MGHIDNDRLLAAALDIGEQILICGGEVSRVEDTIRRICSAMGAERTDVFCITSSIVVTMQREGGITSQTRRITGVHTDFTKLEQLNELSREICEGRIPPETIGKRAEEIAKPVADVMPLYIFGHVLTALTFVLFFGGTWRDALCAGVGALLILFLDRMVKPILQSALIWSLLTAFLTGLFAVGCEHFGLCPSSGMVIIGDIMLLIPGVAFTNSLRDLMTGNTISGLLRLMEALILAGMLAIGFSMAVLLWR